MDCGVPSVDRNSQDVDGKRWKVPSENKRTFRYTAIFDKRAQWFQNKVHNLSVVSLT